MGVGRTIKLGGRAERSEGFTLIEILVVVVVLGILAAVIVMAAQNMASTSAVQACKADFKTIETAQESYRVQVGTSATSFADLTGTTMGVNGHNVGPWIKEAPSTSNGYVIGFDPTPGINFGNITVASTNPAHAATDGNANCRFA